MPSGTLVLAFTSLAIGSLIIDINSQEPSQAPQVQTESKSDSALESEKHPSEETRTTKPAPSGAPHIVPLAANKESQDEARHREEEGSEFWTPLAGYRVKITDSLLAIFTFLLFVATVLLWLATRRLVRGAEDTARRQLRAYVSVASRRSILIVGAIPEARLVVKNHGQTPAYDAVTFVAGRVMEAEAAL